MALGSQKGSPVPLIIFVVLFVFAAVGFALTAMELSSARKTINFGVTPTTPGVSKYENRPGLKLMLLQKDSEIADLRDALDKFRAYTGFINPDNASDATKQLAAKLVDIRDGKTAQPTTLIGLIQELDKQKIQLAGQLDSERKAHAEDRGKLAALTEESDKRLTEKQKLVDERDAQIAKLNGEFQAAQSASRDEVTTLRDTLEKARTDFEKDQNAKNQEIMLLKKENEDLRSQMAKRAKSYEGKGESYDVQRDAPDGEINFLDKNGLIVVDIGQKQGVRRGQRFEVFAEKADGSRVEHGEIEIKIVYDKVSRAVLLDGGNPIDVLSVGDILVNPAFTPGRANVFVADSGFDTASTEALRKALEQYGSILEDDISVRTDYVIIGNQPGKIAERAEKLGIVLIREDELNRLLGR